MAYKYQSKSGVEVKLTRNQIIAFAIIAFIVVSVFLLYLYTKPPEPVYTVTIDDKVIGFRADLREASKVPVYPNEIALFREIAHQLVTNITIAFKPATGDQGIYSVEAFEITYKLLRYVYPAMGTQPTVNVMEVESFDNLPGKIQNPIIVLVHPRYANETSVRVKDHVVFISGKFSKDPTNPYKNLDLATAKFLMVILGIKV